MRFPRHGIKPAIRAALFGGTALGAALLFVGGPGPLSPRSLSRVWDLGHVLLFAAAGILFLTSPFSGGLSARRRALWLLSGALALGLGTEALQWCIGRDAEIGDVLRDVLGASAALAFAPGREARAFRGAVALLLVLALLPAVYAGWDEWCAWREFPLLDGFESRRELGRWTGNASLSISREVSREGRASLRLRLGTDPYSGAFLSWFPRDWRGFRVLSLSVYDPDPVPLELVCRIHDEAHLQGSQEYSDRFNRSFRLLPGWNELRVPLSDVASAPAGRRLDLRRVRAVGLFTVSLPRPRTIYLDEVRLVP